MMLCEAVERCDSVPLIDGDRVAVRDIVCVRVAPCDAELLRVSVCVRVTA